MGFKQTVYLLCMLYGKDILCNNGIFLQHTNLICQHKFLTSGYNLDRCGCAALCSITVECQGLCFNSNGSISCIFIPEPAINLYHASVKKNTWKYFEIIQPVCHSVKYVYHRRMEICFKFYYDKKTWVDAEKRCNGDNGKLLSLQNKTKYKLFINFLQLNKVKGRFFMGLRNHTWQSGDEFTHTHGIIFLLDDIDREYPHDGDSSCGILVVQASSYYEDGSCNNRVEKFVCEIVP